MQDLTMEEQKNCRVKNTESDRTRRDLQEWKLPDLKTRAPIATVKKAEFDNVRINRRAGKRRNL